MESRLFTKILLRLLAIYLIVRGIMVLPDFYLIPLSSAQFRSAGLNSYVWFVIPVFVPIVAGIVLWVISPFIASWIVGADDQKLDVPMMLKNNVQEIVIGLAGLVIVIVAIPEVVNLLIRAFAHSFYDGQHRVFNVDGLALLIAAILQLLLGLSLFLGVRFWGRVLQGAREFGLSKSQ